MLRRLAQALGTRTVRGTLLELAGLGLLVVAAWDVARPLGLAAGGLALLLLAIVVEASRR